VTDPTRLIAALADVERHVSDLGWDQPARLFALVGTKDLLEREPQLAGRVPQGADDAMSAVEQDEFTATDNVFKKLSEIYFPETVEGVALALERTMLPSEHEDEVPAGDADAADFVRKHPKRIDVRIVVGVTRDGARHGLARLKSNPDDLLGAEDLVPGLADALMETLRSENE
jgi:hypothetical protein